MSSRCRRVGRVLHDVLGQADRHHDALLLALAVLGPGEIIGHTGLLVDAVPERRTWRRRGAP